MKNIFNSIKLPPVDSNRFNLSHDVKLSMRMGELVPTCIMDVLPGDTVQITVENMLRFAPLISPVMHKVNVTTHYFFVPNRILWPEWEQWIMRQTEAEAPYFQLEGSEDECEQGSLADYMGIPTGTPTKTVKVSALPFAAYYKIWNEYYRDQNLQNEVSIASCISGLNSDFNDVLDERPKKRAWNHDYFTSALPFAQKGDAVQIPLTLQDDIPVQFQVLASAADGVPKVRNPYSGFTSPDAGLIAESGEFRAGTGVRAGYDPDGTLVVDVQSDAVDINTLRRAFRLQEWLERNARGGTRYTEGILSHFGVKSPDARLQRPEYIGGSKQNMVISEVLATAETTAAGIAVGTMAGHGISVGGGNSFDYTAKEHGYIIGIINVQPVTAYQQGLHRHFSRFDPLDYAWPTFANIGEQEVLQKEVRMDVISSLLTPESVFGYVPRYSEYKYMNPRVSGEMRNDLSYWHLARIFDSDPVLNNIFIECDPSTRIFAVTDENVDHIYAHIFNNISAVRKLPVYGIPTI